jgi:triosephosphate isomerase
MESVNKLIKDLNSGDIPNGIDVVCAPPSVFLQKARDELDSSKYQVAAQNMWVSGPGAFTGEICGEMLLDINVPWVILGHSERRQIFGESNEMVGKKCARALSIGLNALPCIGETLEQRNSGNMFKVLDGQLQALVDNITDWSRVVIAYEPVWAIGTGVVATPQQAQEAHAFVRGWLTEKLGKDTAEGIRILYGGSVNDQNCDELAQQLDVDGFLVGGASLKGPSFVKICQSGRVKADRQVVGNIVTFPSAKTRSAEETGAGAGKAVSA